MPFIKKHGLPITKKSGVYSITNLTNGKVYVGSALCLHGRLLAHRGCLRRGVHDNTYLQRAWNKYGESAFRFDVLTTCDPDMCIEWEQYWIDTLEATNRANGYNLRLYAESNRGIKYTGEALENIRAIKRAFPPSAVANAAESNRGKKRPPEVRAKISAANKGKKRSTQAIANLTANHWSKRPDAAEITARSAAKHRGKKHSEEHKAKIGTSHWKNRPDAEAIAAKVKAAATGRKHTDEAKAKMSESLREAWKTRRLNCGGTENTPI